MDKEESLKMARDVGFGNYAYEAAYMFKDLANAILERAAVECDKRSKEMEQTSLSHAEDSPSRDRCMARAKEAFYLSQDIRALKTENCV